LDLWWECFLQILEDKTNILALTLTIWYNLTKEGVMKVEEEIMRLKIKVDRLIAYVRDLPIQTNWDLEDDIEISLRNANLEEKD